ncbi:MAG TPA: hypothetical protein VEW93_00405 [Acidimicrobiales bacterium]|nr:hypothetical protein [Acidimicrobiales bacterium]
MARRGIELRHLWGCHPLWDVGRERDVDPAALGLPRSVVDRLGAWAARWDSTFGMDQPDKRKVEQFVIDELGRDGARLWRALLGLLDPQDHEVTYLHEGVTYRRVEDLPPEWRFG